MPDRKKKQKEARQKVDRHTWMRVTERKRKEQLKLELTEIVETEHRRPEHITTCKLRK